MAPSCFCFSLCTSADARRFARILPTDVDVRGASRGRDAVGWHAYLFGVYGPSPPAHAANISRFSFFYHHHDAWPSGLEWPMATCVPHAGGKWQRDPATPRCEPGWCDQSMFSTRGSQSMCIAACGVAIALGSRLGPRGASRDAPSQGPKSAKQ